MAEPPETPCAMSGRELAPAPLDLSPSADERACLVSMRNELLVEDFAYWHDDPAIRYIERVCGEPAIGVDEHMHTLLDGRGPR